MRIFYCAKCNTVIKNFKFKNTMQEIENTTWVNSRDGCGEGIRHIICPKCGYVLSGIMQDRDGDLPIDYIKYVIDMYSCGSGEMLVDHDKLVFDLEQEVKDRKLRRDNK